MVAGGSVNHQGQFPAVTISFNTAPNVALSQAVDAIKKAEHDVGLPAGAMSTFSGTAKAFSDSLGSEPFLILFALFAVYNAPFCRGWRAGGVAYHQDGAEHHRAHRHSPARRHREEECDLDDRLRHRCGAD